MTTNILNFEIDANGHAIIRYVTTDGERNTFDLTAAFAPKPSGSMPTMVGRGQLDGSVELTHPFGVGGLAGGVMTEQLSGFAPHQDYQGLTRQGVIVQSKIDKGDD